MATSSLVAMARMRTRLWADADRSTGKGPGSAFFSGSMLTPRLPRPGGDGPAHVRDLFTDGVGEDDAVGALGDKQIGPQVLADAPQVHFGSPRERIVGLLVRQDVANVGGNAGQSQKAALAIEHVLHFATVALGVRDERQRRWRDPSRPSACSSPAPAGASSPWCCRRICRPRWRTGWHRRCPDGSSRRAARPWG
jgi:hypothetical protein